MVCKQTKRNNPLGRKSRKNKRNSLFFCSLKQNFVPLDKLFALCKEGFFLFCIINHESFLSNFRGSLHHRVFIECNSAEQRIVNGLLSVTLKIFNLPNCLYTKKSCEFLQSYRKSREMQKESLLFFFIPET